MKIKLLTFFINWFAKMLVDAVNKQDGRTSNPVYSVAVKPDLVIPVEENSDIRIAAYNEAMQNRSVFAFSRTAMGKEIITTMDYQGSVGHTYVANVALLMMDIHEESKPDYTSQSDREAVAKKILAKIFG